MRTIPAFLRADDIPPLARPAYWTELRHMLLWGLFANLIDGTFSSIVVLKTFDASPLLATTVWATPLLANLLSLGWGVVLRGRPKVRTFVILAAGAVLSAGSIALTPASWIPWGGWIFALQIALARIFLSGLITVRTSIWKANYPQSHRARIAGRLQALSALLLLGMGIAVSRVFDCQPGYYRLVYPLLALLGVLSLLPLRRLRIRGEDRELEEFRAATAQATAAGRWTTLLHGFRECAAILRHDRPFARYCTAQYLLGSANFMVDPVLPIYLTQKVGLGYFGSYLLMELIPAVLTLLTIGRWARHYDRVGVLRFRIWNSAFWLISVLLAAAALLVNCVPTELLGRAAPHLAGWRFTLWGAPFGLITLVALAILALGRVANGIGRSGGAIAWNIGHLQFAGAHNAELYLGIHVALTGFRGIIMPFVGTWLYGLVGPSSLLVAGVLTVLSLQSFRRLTLEYERSRRAVVAEAGRTPEMAPLSVAEE